MGVDGSVVTVICAGLEQSHAVNGADVPLKHSVQVEAAKRWLKFMSLYAAATAADLVLVLFLVGL